MKKLWEKWCDKQVEQTAIGIRDDWKKFAETGSCIGIMCSCCVFKYNRECAGISLKERIAKLNEEEQ